MIGLTSLCNDECVECDVTCDGVVVWAALETWEHGLVDLLLQLVHDLLPILANLLHS